MIANKHIRFICLASYGSLALNVKLFGLKRLLLLQNVLWVVQYILPNSVIRNSEAPLQNLESGENGNKQKGGKMPNHFAQYGPIAKTDS